jgi:hypothetical protein
LPSGVLPPFLVGIIRVGGILLVTSLLAALFLLLLILAAGVCICGSHIFLLKAATQFWSSYLAAFVWFFVLCGLPWLGGISFLAFPDSQLAMEYGPAAIGQRM